MWILCNCLVGALLYLQYVISFPLHGVKVLYSAQYDLQQLDHRLGFHRNTKKTRRKTDGNRVV